MQSGFIAVKVFFWGGITGEFRDLEFKHTLGGSLAMTERKY
jgi:nitrogen fixation-related uncharacterized protein